MKRRKKSPEKKWTDRDLHRWLPPENVNPGSADHAGGDPWGTTVTRSQTLTDYGSFLSEKSRHDAPSGKVPESINEGLYDFQAAIVKWAVRRGRAAIFADCGLGKTLMQVEWARQIGGRVLIVAPLGVVRQSECEARKIGVLVTQTTGGAPLVDGLFITNYEKLDRFTPRDWDAVVLDESSILKSIDGKTRTKLIREWSGVPSRLCCTATPSPNDIAEMANHAEFLGVMTRAEMLATFFVHDSDVSGVGGWRLKGWARDRFWKWMASWCVYFRRPSDIGFEDAGFVLPPIAYQSVMVETQSSPAGMLFPMLSGGIGGRLNARRATMVERVSTSARLIKSTPGHWIVWCGLNDEGRGLASALDGGAAVIEGATPENNKLEREVRWRTEGNPRVLITKPKIYGFGMNWQHCNNVMFLGIGDSYEQYYQAVRRCWRFGQQRPVNVVIVTSDLEVQVLDNVKRKEAQVSELIDGIVSGMRDFETSELGEQCREQIDYSEDDAAGHSWKMMLGDCVTRIREIEDGSVALSLFSPPFASLYTYSASDRDMGNSSDYDEFFRHFNYLIPELLRVMMAGRRCCVHVQQISMLKARDGAIGWRDFRADVVRHFVAAGFVYDGEVVIDKDPQAQAIRTKSKALLFIQKERDASWLRPAMADYILCFRHPGDNPVPILPDVSNEEWIMWARPIWYGIRESDTLQVAEARSEKDERHICPLQLGTIERCVRLWSNPGEIVFSPFAGIGSEGYVALQHERRFVGIELKRQYFEVAVKNLRRSTAQQDLPLENR